MKKNEKGITLTALVIYITVMSVVVAAISTITTYTYKNMNNVEEEGQYAVELNKFDMYFLKDIKKAENIAVQEGTNKNKVSMQYYDENSNEIIVTYEYSGQYVIRSDGNSTINICKNVTRCQFNLNEKKLKVELTINGTYQKNMDYIVENLF